MNKVLNALKIALLEKEFDVREYPHAIIVDHKISGVPYMFTHCIVDTIDKINVFSYDIDTFVTIDEAIELLTH